MWYVTTAAIFFGLGIYFDRSTDKIKSFLSRYI